MNTIGRKIYFDKQTGNIILDTGERQGSVLPTTIEQDIATYTTLSERNRDSYAVLDLPYGAYRQDFNESTSYRVNLETLKLEFTYPVNDAEPEEPVYQAPLTEQVKQLENRTAATEDALLMMMMGGM